MDAFVLKKYESLPDDLQKEVIDFIDFLGSKYKQQMASSVPLAQKRASLFGNAKGLITILPGFDDVPEGFEDYQ
ncbi:DUF2281 domain-containing protein [Spirosoma sp. HMF3257]|uniref:DUF2281 domain-containing protein n=1 Tax=Spirosoma telluris TaxID=2183553 RepID=A0A327NM86_9BACT|nr:DUF2281 domain-containing protein [Spirosoma telluris]RAI73718.1 DUF2281 domain-containing protein [Spirosoma telluris]